MSLEGGFLKALANTLNIIGLYHEGHPARDRAIRRGWDALEQLLAELPAARFTFLEERVVCGNRVLQELGAWALAGRLAGLGIERLEFIAPVSIDEYAGFVFLLHRHLTDKAAAGDLEPASPPTGIRYGAVSVGGESLEELAFAAEAASVAYDLHAEVEAVGWVQSQAASGTVLPVVETETIIRSLALAMRQHGELILPLLEYRGPDQYARAHACNVAVLAMGLAENLGYAPREVRAIGMAGMLADIGTVGLPKELLLKQGPLSEAERRLVEGHCVEGARLILQRHPRMELAAVVAYEHHLDLDGGGYPRTVFRREPHFASRLIRICDCYDAAVSPRSWRGPMDLEGALDLLAAGAGTRFDPDLLGPFTSMVRQAKVQRLPIENPVLEVAGERRDGGGPTN